MFFGGIGPSLCHLAGILGRWGAMLEPSWPVPVPTLGRLGAILVPLGPSLAPELEIVENLMVFHDFGGSRRRSRRIRRSSGGHPGTISYFLSPWGAHARGLENKNLISVKSIQYHLTSNQHRPRASLTGTHTPLARLAGELKSQMENAGEGAVGRGVWT